MKRILVVSYYKEDGRFNGYTWHEKERTLIEQKIAENNSDAEKELRFEIADDEHARAIASAKDKMLSIDSIDAYKDSAIDSIKSAISETEDALDELRDALNEAQK